MGWGGGGGGGEEEIKVRKKKRGGEEREPSPGFDNLVFLLGRCSDFQNLCEFW